MRSLELPETSLLFPILIKTRTFAKIQGQESNGLLTILQAPPKSELLTDRLF
jgi:hypothetical protein